MHAQRAHEATPPIMAWWLMGAEGGRVISFKSVLTSCLCFSKWNPHSYSCKQWQTQWEKHWVSSPLTVMKLPSDSSWSPYSIPGRHWDWLWSTRTNCLWSTTLLLPCLVSFYWWSWNHNKLFYIPDSASTHQDCTCYHFFTWEREASSVSSLGGWISTMLWANLGRKIAFPSASGTPLSAIIS